MVWALFLIIYGEQVREGFNSQMIATYETAEECIQVANELKYAGKETSRDMPDWLWVESQQKTRITRPQQYLANVKYKCALTIQQ